jgi:formate dehydrogenase
MLEGHVLRLPAGGASGILPASMSDIPLDFDTLNQYGCFIGSAAIVILSNKDTAAMAARNVMKSFRRVVRTMHALPCRHGEALDLMKEQRWDRPLIGTVAGDDGFIDLRPRSGRAESGAIGVKYFPREVE